MEKQCAAAMDSLDAMEADTAAQLFMAQVERGGSNESVARTLDEEVSVTAPGLAPTLVGYASASGLGGAFLRSLSGRVITDTRIQREVVLTRDADLSDADDDGGSGDDEAANRRHDEAQQRRQEHWRRLAILDAPTERP